VNAVERYSELVAPEAIRRLAALRVVRFDAFDGGDRRQRDIDEARARVLARWADDLCGLLNAMTRGELAALASALRIDSAGRSHDLRARLWDHGAALERAGLDIALAVQPRPIVLGGHLVVQSPPRGAYPPAASWPRPVPAARAPAPPADEPDTLDELLAAADRAIGVRLGGRGRDKGAWGTRAATLVGVVERGDGEPDWRGDVELKTVPIARDPSGAWRIVEDPAIAMVSERGREEPQAPPARSERNRIVGEGTAIAKLQRTLWLARADVDGGDATIVSWYLLEWDAELARLARRYLHERPKGPAGTDQRGLYMHKRFFADAGLLATLNGPTC
jgi:hypothetical protein